MNLNAIGKYGFCQVGFAGFPSMEILQVGVKSFSRGCDLPISNSVLLFCFALVHAAPGFSAALQVFLNTKYKYSNTNTQTQTQNLCDKCKTQMQIYMFSFYLWDLIWEFIWKMVWISSLEVTSSPTQKHQCKRYCRKSGTYPHFPRFKSNLWFHH